VGLDGRVTAVDILPRVNTRESHGTSPESGRVRRSLRRRGQRGRRRYLTDAVDDCHSITSVRTASRLSRLPVEPPLSVLAVDGGLRDRFPSAPPSVTRIVAVPSAVSNVVSRTVVRSTYCCVPSNDLAGLCWNRPPRSGRESLRGYSGPRRGETGTSRPNRSARRAHDAGRNGRR